MAGFLDDVAAERDALLGRIDALEATWRRAPSLPGRTPDDGLVLRDLDRLRTELTRRRFTVGVFGLIKRGKSTLVNTLLGAEVSPTHVTPETAVPVHVEHGSHLRAEVHMACGDVLEIPPHEVAEWTSQKHNPHNELGVTHVRWTMPSPLLDHGVRLVDTPGLDDADADGLYTERTIQELDAADAGILVFLSPPTVGATEMAFLREVTAAHLRKVLLVANMYPQHYHDPGTREEILAYVQARIAEVTGVADVAVHAVCAQEAWEARTFGDHDRFARAGGAALIEALERTIATHTGAGVLGRAEHALARIAEVADAELRLRRKALDGTGLPSRTAVAERAHRLEVEAEDRHRRELGELDGLRAQLHGRVHQTFIRTRHELAEATSVDDLERLLTRFTRQAEVVTEQSFRVLRARLATLERQAAEDLDADVADTLVELGGVVPATRGWLGETGEASSARSTVGSAAVGGLVAGGAGFALVGAMLGPIGVLAGAMIGWRVGGTLRDGRRLKPLRAEVDRRLDEVADALLAEFDRRADALVTAVSEHARRRRSGFASDLEDALAFGEAAVDPEERADLVARLEAARRELRTLVHPDLVAAPSALRGSAVGAS